MFGTYDRPLFASTVFTLLDAVKARGLKKGLAALCIGGGEATALTFGML